MKINMHLSARIPWIFWLRLSVIFVLLLCSCRVAFSQIDSIKVTFTTSEAMKLTEYLNYFSSNNKINFYYKDEWFDTYYTKDTFQNISLSKALDILFKDKPYIYEVIGDGVIFFPKGAVEFYNSNIKNPHAIGKDINTIVIGDPNDAGKYNEVSLTGKVTDGKDDQPLPSATVVVENSGNATITHLNGSYLIKMKPGYHTIEYSSIGYQKSKSKIQIIGDGELNVQLFESSFSLEEITVYAQKMDRNVSRNQMSIIEMDAKSLKQIPILTGEKDVLKGLTLMPGVKSVGEFGSGINVRGGGEDQNLYLIEDAPLFNTAHVFGLLSVLNPDAVENITLYKGHMPAFYGERVSSVMKIDLKSNIPERFNSRGGIGLYNNRLMLEAPLIKEKLSLRIGGRSSYSNWLLKQMNDFNLRTSSASFYDINGTLNWNGKKDHITLMGYSSFDNFTYASRLSYGYGNTLGSFRWNHIYKGGFASSLTLAHSSYFIDKDEIQNEFYKNRITSKISYSSINIRFSNNNLNKHYIDGGVKTIFYKIRPGHQKPLGDFSLINEQVLEHEQAAEWAAFISDEYSLNKNISINLGIRYSLYQYLGPGNIYNYMDRNPRGPLFITDTTYYNRNENISLYHGFEPRLSLKYQLTEKNSVKISYNRNYQYVNLLSYTSIATPEDRWKLSDPWLKPVLSNQYALGYYHNFYNNKLETSFELYYKDLSHLKEFKNNASIVMVDHIETELLETSGKNYGMELFVKKNFGKFDGWLSYTWSRSFRKTDGELSKEIINENSWFPSSFDKPHDLNLITTYHVNRRVRLSGSFSFSSGRAITLPEYQYPFGQNMLIYYSERNKYRLRPYHRLDLSIHIDESLRKAKKWKGSWTFSLMNVYGRKNAYSVFYKKETPDYTNDYRWFSMYKMYLIGVPFPTVSYNFIF